ncbi:MAG: hypothetical protein H6904_04055 [Rhodobacteraceae bacterium]|nr:hypothetical protein [Paracoccaceae bacterium]
MAEPIMEEDPVVEAASLSSAGSSFRCFCFCLIAAAASSSGGGTQFR